MLQSEYQAYDWNKPAFGNLAANLEFLDQLDVSGRKAKVLEIGVGRGWILNHLFRQKHDVVGIDIDAGLVAEIKRMYGRIPCLVGSAEDLPFDRSSFGTVLSFDVFEHIPDSDRHLQEVNRVLKPDGHYIFQTPNKWLNMIFEPIRFTRKFGVRNAFDFLNEHCSLHNYWELEKRLKYNGFEVKYYDIPVVNQYFETKIKTYLGNLGMLMLDLLDTFQFFERLPLALRPNFFVQAIKR